MKLHFEPNLDYQLQAIEAVCDLFRGQEICRTEFTVTRDAVGGADAAGFRRKRPRHRQPADAARRRAAQEPARHPASQRPARRPARSPPGDFTVEMETGTGKTYVYLRTIFELNKRYGFTKFVIVVPSVAIKEGVYKSLQITEEHFKGALCGRALRLLPLRLRKLGQVRNFATSPQIQIMVVTVGAINKKDVNNLYKDSEKTGGEKPIDLIKATRPILIVDEPQSVDGGLDGAGKTGARCDEPALHAALLGHARGQAPHGLSPRRGGRLRAQAGQADRSRGGHGRGRAQQALRAARVGEQQARQHLGARSSWTCRPPAGVQRQEVTVQDGDDLEQTTGRADLRGLPHRRDPRRARATSSWSCACPAASSSCRPAKPGATWTRWRCSAR